jgi:hypothetical protein
VGCITGSRGQLPGERKPVIRDDDNYNSDIVMITTKKVIYSIGTEKHSVTRKPFQEKRNTNLRWKKLTV